MDKFQKTYTYSKGVYDAKFFDANRNLLYYDNKLTESNIEVTSNDGILNAGVGNPEVIAIPDTAAFNVTLTAADVELRSRQLQTGGELSYNGVTDTCEVIVANSTTLTVTGTPVAPYGSTKIVGYVNGDGTAYEINPETKQVQGFTATSGQQYAVRYYVSKAASEVLDIKALFTPEIGTLEIKYPLYSTNNPSNLSQGTLVGYWHVIAPRFQFSGNASFNGNQTEFATSPLNGRALAFDNPAENVCGGATPSLVYMVWEPFDATSGVTDMVVLNGGQMTVAASASASIPVRYVMQDGLLSVPAYSDLQFTSGASGTASVENGVVTGVAAGSTEITIKNTALNLEAVVQVDVE